MLFGLACEGVTDQITLENILCGYFKNRDLDQEIVELQPAFDETDHKQGDGGWSILLKYLSSTRFRDDVLNTEFVILQIDTDISESLDVSHKDARGNDLPVQQLIKAVIAKLIARIDMGEVGFYDSCSDKIIFAVCVHSLECWLVAHYAQQTQHYDCYGFLKSVINTHEFRVAKKHRNYDKLSQPFLVRQNIDNSAKKDLSLRVFIQSLAKIEDQ
ncbi:MAG: hypothetical protein ABL925_13400, partial [Methylococcales bacterium]